MAIHQEDLPGDILLFLTGQDECEAGTSRGRGRGRARAVLLQASSNRRAPVARSPASSAHPDTTSTTSPCRHPPLPAAVRLLEDEGRRLQRSRLKWRLQPAALYAGLPATHQLAAFQPAARGVRKVGRVFGSCG